jgi:hypothetical protein
VTELTTSKTSKSEDSELPVVSILKEAGGPLTTRELQAEVKKVISFCPSASVIGLNLLRIAGTIKGKRLPDRKGWIWWIED